MLTVKNLSVELEDAPILKEIDFQVNPGEIHVVLGPNGSGKSTLGRTLLGDEKYEVTDGEVLFEGEDFLALEPHERAQKGFFLSFQSPPELDGVSAKDLLLAGKKSIQQQKISSFKFKRQLEQCLTTFHLSDSFADREMNKGASGGERTKMEMVSLLTLQPKLAFLDEIDSGIDVDGIHAIADGIQTFMKLEGRSIILISHTDKLFKLIQPTHVHVLHGGKIVEQGGGELIEKIHTAGFMTLSSQKNAGLAVVK